MKSQQNRIELVTRPDDRVMSNMLALEGCYIPDLDWSYMRQSEIRLHMRKTVAEWMLDVCVDQACQSDVFLLSTNIMDRSHHQCNFVIVHAY